MTIIIFFVVLSILVLAHEWGHFITAKRAGAKVEEFGFGFPPRLFSFKKNGTVFSLNLIPFGGFVKIFGESGEHHNESGSFASLKISRRAVVIVAGVVMNIVLAWVLLSAGNIIGRPEIIDSANESLARSIGLQILDVVKGSPAEQAGLKSSDQILDVTLSGINQTLVNIDEFQKFISQNAGTEIKLNVKRGQEIVGVNIIPRKKPPAGEGPLGISLIKVGLVKTPWYWAWWQGAKDTANLMRAIVSGLFFFFKILILQGRILGDIAGPVGIASLTGQAYQMGWSYLIQLMAVLSVNLAILNILPFPALDGGRLILLAIEKIKGSPLSQKIEQSINAFGFVLLLGLMLFITWKDIVKLF